MKKRMYDVVFSIGSTCRCSMALREGRLQYYSFPFDWTGGPTANEKVSLLCRDFKGWMRRESFVQVSENKYDHSAHWLDKDLGYVFVHEFDTRSTIDEQLPVVRERLMARGRRLQSLIAKASRVLVVYIEAPEFQHEDRESLLRARGQLMRKWPDAEFDMLMITHEENRGWRDFSDASTEGVRLVTFDIKDRHERDGSWVIDHVTVGKWLARYYVVVDYRTPEERAQWARREREKKFARFHATSELDFLLMKMRWKFYVHFRKALERRGVI